MFIHLSDQSPDSLQSQLVQQVRALILHGDLKTDDSLPSIRQLARQQRVSVITVQRAYETLEQMGLVHVRRGKGYFVSSLEQGDRLELARATLLKGLAPLVRQALAEGMSSKDISETLEAELEEATDERTD